MRGTARWIPLLLLAASTLVADGPAKKAVIVELFTSEGCSSCPPADRLLGELWRLQPVEGVEIVPLSLHVDYWNDLGWADPFSAPEYTERQYAYAASIARGRVYTPQMVVQGRWEFVGNDPEKALAALGQIRDDELADVTLGPITLIDERQIEVPVEARYAAGKKRDGKLRLWLAITENDLASEVARGENRGRTLEHVGVVRELRALDDGRPDGGSIVAQPTVRLAKDWQPSQLRVVAFLQRAPGGPILAAAVSDLPPTP